MTLIVNLYGGPGTGKSTTAAGVFSLLKQRGVNCEYVSEYAKDRVWEEHFKVFDNQLFVFARQYQRVRRMLGKVDAVITDAPLLLSLHYGAEATVTFRKLVYECYAEMRNLDIFLTRKKAYNPIGRMQTEEQAKGIDFDLRNLLALWEVDCLEVDGVPSAIPDIAATVQEAL